MNFVKKSAVSLFLVCAGCRAVPDAKTVILPPPQTELRPSFDGEDLDSGIKEYVDGKGFLISLGAKLRYEKLAELYGSSMVPPVSGGLGISKAEGNYFYMSSEAMSNFVVWTDKYKSGRK